VCLSSQLTEQFHTLEQGLEGGGDVYLTTIITIAGALSKPS